MAFRTLPRPQFASLQTSIFPIYFGLQAGLPIVAALTAGGQVGASGVLHPDNRYSTLLPLATVTVVGLVNQYVLRPLTVNTMKQRYQQGKCIQPHVYKERGA